MGSTSNRGIENEEYKKISLETNGINQPLSSFIGEHEIFIFNMHTMNLTGQYYTNLNPIK